MKLTGHSMGILSQQIENVLRQTEKDEKNLQDIIAELPQLLKQRMQILQKYVPPVYYRETKLKLEAEICRIIAQIDEQEKFQFVYQAQHYPTAKIEETAEELHFERRDQIAFTYIISYLRVLLMAQVNDRLLMREPDNDGMLASSVLRVESLILGVRISENTIRNFAQQKSTSS